MNSAGQLHLAPRHAEKSHTTNGMSNRGRTAVGIHEAKAITRTIWFGLRRVLPPERGWRGGSSALRGGA